MTLLIVGASARAAAQSARRAGLEPAGIDLFADRDLSTTGPVVAIDAARYPEGLAEAAATVGPGPWLYTGAVENHPDLIAAIAARRPLYGNGPAALRVRDPRALQAALAAAGLPALCVARAAEGLPRDGSWLVKPIRSAGGRGVRRLTEPAGRATAQETYYQERADGVGIGAVGLASDGGRHSELLGLTLAWTGRPGAPFAYRGSIGPVVVGERTRSTVEAMLRAVASTFGLAGLFGIDLIVRPDGTPLAVEVNPRYTASVEVLELATGRALLAEHARACDPSAALAALRLRADRPAAVGKAIVFAPGPCRAPVLDDWRPVGDPWEVPPLADVPRPGVVFEAGDPVLTLLEPGASPADCRARLEARLAEWDERLRRPPWAEPAAVGGPGPEEGERWSGSGSP